MTDQPRKVLLGRGNWADIDLWETNTYWLEHLFYQHQTRLRRRRMANYSKWFQEQEGNVQKHEKSSLSVSSSHVLNSSSAFHEREIMMRAHQRDDSKDKCRNSGEKRGGGFLDLWKHRQPDTTSGGLCVSTEWSLEHEPSAYVQVFTRPSSPCSCVCVTLEAGNKKYTHYPKCTGFSSRGPRAVLRLLLKIPLMSHASVDFICHHLCAHVQLNETETRRPIRCTKQHLGINTHLGSVCGYTSTCTHHGNACTHTLSVSTELPVSHLLQQL